MKEISKRAYQAVEEDEIKLHPAKFKNTYRHWMENVRDWCISRQFGGAIAYPLIIMEQVKMILL
jgi:valyl-tRNA synthetase